MQFPLEECSISQIFFDPSQANKYVIPIYQRNYAWSKEEITQLVDDVYDSMKKIGKPTYYIGTLVTYRREDNIFEVIDGQQRLTTLFLILKALGETNFKSVLTYSARKASVRTLENLENLSLIDEWDKGIVNGFEFAKNALDKIDNSDLNDFKNYFKDKVHLIHYNVPRDVDLNHYFEVMNSRGEQLEKHEIVKSILSEAFSDNKERTTFCRLWESCSQMNEYIQTKFPYSDVFSKTMDSFIINSFDELPLADDSEGKKTIKEILKENIEYENKEEKEDKVDKFQAIIDFPNFLLIVLKLTRIMREGKNFEPSDFILDDKELLQEFGKITELKNKNSKLAFVKEFSFNLIKAKFLLDNYLVHHVANDVERIGDNPWKLQKYFREKKASEKERRYYKNLTDKKEIQDGLEQILSMFEVTYTAKSRKNYLLYCLLFLFENMDKPEEYLDFLQDLGDKYLCYIYLKEENLSDSKVPRPNAFDAELLKDGKLDVVIAEDISHYKNKFEEVYPYGNAKVPLFIFNYTDFILWWKYSKSLKGKETKISSPERIKFFEELGCSDFRLEPFMNFYFSRTRKSLEHFFPQANVIAESDVEEKECLTKEQINCFGNFAMIGSEANSSGSNWNPKLKQEKYTDKKSDPISVASLKFKIMLQKCKDNIKDISNGELNREDDMAWNFEDIQEHQSKMIDMIFETVW